MLRLILCLLLGVFGLVSQSFAAGTAPTASYACSVTCGGMTASFSGTSSSNSPGIQACAGLPNYTYSTTYGTCYTGYGTPNYVACSPVYTCSGTPTYSCASGSTLNTTDNLCYPSGGIVSYISALVASIAAQAGAAAAAAVAAAGGTTAADAAAAAAAAAAAVDAAAQAAGEAAAAAGANAADAAAAAAAAASAAAASAAATAAAGAIAAAGGTSAAAAAGAAGAAAAVTAAASEVYSTSGLSSAVASLDTTALNAVTGQQSADESYLSSFFNWVPPGQEACSPITSILHLIPVSLDICPTVLNIRDVIGWIFAIFGLIDVYGSLVGRQGA